MPSFIVRSLREGLLHDDDKDGRDHALPGPEARHLRPAQEGAGLPAEELCRELRAVDLRQPGRARRQDAGARRRRALLQSRGDPDRDPHGRGERFRQGHGRAGRNPVDAGGFERDPQIQGLRRHHPVGEPQSRRPARGFRHQIQRREWRAGAGEADRRDLRALQEDQRIQDRRSGADRHRQAEAR